MKIQVIATGGTIGSETSKSGISTRSVDERIIDEVLSEKPAGFQTSNHEFIVSYPMNLLSENMVPYDWLEIANSIREAISKKVDAIVITHGTDTMAYTMAAVAFILYPLTIPIVFTGALKTFDEENSDAPANLWDAIAFAEHQVKNKAYGVYLVFQGQEKTGVAYWGPRVQSIKHGGKYFHTIDNNRIARIVDGKVEDYKFYFGRSKQPVMSDQSISAPELNKIKFDTDIEIHKLYPGFNPLQLSGSLSRGIKAIILDMYHSGTGCTREDEYKHFSIASAVRELTKNGVVVLAAGAPFRSNEQYKSLSGLIDSGLKPLGYISLECAVVKTMYLLGKGLSADEFEKQIEKSIVHEIYQGTL